MPLASRTYTLKSTARENGYRSREISFEEEVKTDKGGGNSSNSSHENSCQQSGIFNGNDFHVRRLTVGDFLTRSLIPRFSKTLMGGLYMEGTGQSSLGIPMQVNSHNTRRSLRMLPFLRNSRVCKSFVPVALKLTY